MSIKRIKGEKKLSFLYFINEEGLQVVNIKILKILKCQIIIVE